jgi:oligopeptide/dipeptide ABC transporter ATP-binding protein
VAKGLRVVHYLCDYIAVMYLGIIMETAPRPSLFRSPQNPYTQALLKAIPSIKGELTPIPLSTDSTKQATAINPEPGCRFAPRCPHTMAVCKEIMPKLKEVAPEHMVACHLYS